MPEVAYFTGGDFDWLRAQVGAVLWHHVKPVGVTAPASPPREVGLSDLWAGVSKGAHLPVKAAPSQPPKNMSVAQYNAWRGVDREAAKLPYVYQEYPCILYKVVNGLGKTACVEDARTHDRMLREGWKDTP